MPAGVPHVRHSHLPLVQIEDQNDTDMKRTDTARESLSSDADTRVSSSAQLTRAVPRSI